MRRAALTAGLVAAIAVALVGPAYARHEVGHEPPQGPAKIAFASDFSALVDHEWGFPLGGFGGIRRGHPVDRAPVIFVHGNNVDASDWYPVRDDFRAAGWSDQELWALSYNGLGCNNGSTPRRSNPERDAEREEMGWDGACRVTNNDLNVPDLHDFILEVRRYTGSDRFSLVGHSLGVTVARKTLKLHPELRRDLVAFVGIAGGNKGTNLCPPGSEGVVMSCHELAAGSPWLADLNGPDGEDETYGPARWMTIYDGSGVADVAYLGPYADSPTLRGADNRAFPVVDHNGLRMDPEIVAVYRTFLEEASAAALAEAGDEAGDGTAVPGGSEPAAEALPATGAGTAEALAMFLLGAALLRRRTAPA